MKPTTEKRFNFWFSAFLLTGMVAVSLINFCRYGDEDASGQLMQIIAATSSVLGIASTVFSANASMLTFLFGVLEVVACSIVHFASGFYGITALHVFYFLPMQFVGIWQWRKRSEHVHTDSCCGPSHQDGEKRVKARRFTVKQWLLALFALVAGTLCTAFVLYQIKLHGGEEIFVSKIMMDALVSVANILGLFLMSLAFAEQWYFWLIVNIFSIALWTGEVAAGESSYSFIMMAKYIFYLLNSLNGLRIWINLSKEQA